MTRGQDKELGWLGWYKVDPAQTNPTSQPTKCVYTQNKTGGLIGLVGLAQAALVTQLATNPTNLGPYMYVYEWRVGCVVLWVDSKG